MASRVGKMAAGLVMGPDRTPRAEDGENCSDEDDENDENDADDDAERDCWFDANSAVATGARA